MKILSCAQTDIGLKRKINQDAYLCDDKLGLYIVADGMGGHKGGEVASQLAVDVIRSYCQEHKSTKARDQIDRSINLACKAIYQKSQDVQDLNGMGTTVSVLLFQDNYVYVGQVGDSRAYLLNKGGFWQLTEDHSLLNEEIRAGRIAAGHAEQFQFKNVITRSVGYEGHVAVDIYRRKVEPEDVYLICTDGLSGMVSGEDIASELTKAPGKKGLKRLIELALEGGGDDNVTALLCEVKPD